MENGVPKKIEINREPTAKIKLEKVGDDWQGTITPVKEGEFQNVRCAKTRRRIDAAMIAACFAGSLGHTIDAQYRG